VTPPLHACHAFPSVRMHSMPCTEYPFPAAGAANFKPDEEDEIPGQSSTSSSSASSSSSSSSGSPPPGEVRPRGEINLKIVCVQAAQENHFVVEGPSSKNAKELVRHDFACSVGRCDASAVGWALLGGAKAPDQPTRAPRRANLAMVAGHYPRVEWEGPSGEVAPRSTDYMMGNCGGTASGPLGSVPFSRPP
jgi:hypothetical protein